MTIEEFDKTGFTGQMVCIYKEKEYPIVSVDFEERLIAIYERPIWEYEENVMHLVVSCGKFNTDHINIY